MATQSPATGALVPLRVVAGSLQDLGRTKLPRLHALCTELQRELRAEQGGSLLASLEAHLAACRALRFELLIPAGLRAAASRADEAVFRQQVERLLDATSETWGALRTFMGASAGASARCDVLLSEFVMQARALQRGAAHWAGPLQLLLPRVPEAEATQVHTLLGSLRAFDEACEAARGVRKQLHGLEQMRGEVHAVLHKLGQGLGGNLLEKLRPMVAGSAAVASADIQSAQAARQALQALLATAARALLRLDDGRERLLATLDEVGRVVAPGGWSDTGSAPLPSAGTP